KEAPSGEGEVDPYADLPRAPGSAQRREWSGDGGVCTHPGPRLGRRCRHPERARHLGLVDLQRDQRRPVERRKDARMVEGALRGRPATGQAPERLSRPRGRFGVLRRDEGGTALVEFALIAPLLFLLIFGIIDFGRALNYYNELTQLAGQGARAAAVNRN